MRLVQKLLPFVLLILLAGTLVAQSTPVATPGANEGAAQGLRLTVLEEVLIWLFRRGARFDAVRRGRVRRRRSTAGAGASAACEPDQRADPAPTLPPSGPLGPG